MDDGHCVRCLHAEMAAVINMELIRDESLTAYVTHTPCIDCYKLLTARGVTRIIVKEEYGELNSAYVQLTREIRIPLLDFEYLISSEEG